jgi:hypothetical protein
MSKRTRLRLLAIVLLVLGLLALLVARCTRTALISTPVKSALPATVAAILHR